VATVIFLARRRPRALIATNPPIWLGLISYAYCRLRGASLVLDSHPGGFGAQEDRVAARVQGMHRWLVPRCAGVMVTTEQWADVVRDWGGRPLVLWEAPVAWSVPPPEIPADGRPLRVLCIAVFGPDEPIDVFVEAMNAVTGVTVDITGDRRRAPAGLVGKAAPHISFVGYLRGEHYVAAIAAADLVVTLTTEPTSVMRSGCEAVWAKRPLLVSDSPATREAFPSALHVANTPEALAAAVEQVRDNAAEWTAGVHDAWVRQDAAWRDQAAALTDLLQPKP
jgi:hypothetical protein